MTPPADTFWLHRLPDSDERAYEHLYRTYWSSLYAVAYNHVRSRETAQELVQELFVSLWQRRQQLQVESTDRAYLFTALRYQVYDHIARQKIWQRVVGTVSSGQSEADCSTEHVLAYNELSERLIRAVDTLPDKAQTVFRLSRHEYRTVPEIAQHLNVSPKTVEYYLTQALKQLRIALKELLSWGLVLLCEFSHVNQ